MSGAGSAGARRGEVLRLPAFRDFWLAASISSAGSAVSTVAVPVLVVTVLHATAFEVGVVNAAQVLPYALLGLFAGVLVDRVRRRPLLAVSAIGSAVLLGLIPLLSALDALSLPLVVAVLFGFGCLSVLGFAASQSLLPSLVPRDRLLDANARVDQTAAVAQTAGPAAGGAFVGLLGAPIAVVIDAASFAVEAVLVARIRVVEERHDRAPLHLRRDIAEGLRAAYGHRGLRDLSISAHVWFIANAAAATIFVPFALRDLRTGPVGFGMVLAISGVATLGGALLSARSGMRFGSGIVVLGGRILYPVAWAAVALAPSGVVGLVVLAAGLSVAGFAGGLENANEMGYRQAVTPDALLGRVNATLRSANRTAAVLGALGGGLLATAAGPRSALGVCVLVFVIAAIVIAVSPFARARVPDDPDTLAG